MSLALFVVILLTLLSVLPACGESIPTSTNTMATEIPLISPVPTMTMTPIPPTATPIPMAAIVNGVGITLEEFEAELRRYLSAQGNTGSEDQIDADKIVLEDLISHFLSQQCLLYDRLLLWHLLRELLCVQWQL